MAFKIPESVLVVVHTARLDVLLLERAAQPGLWQSVTGSREPDDPDLSATARRELVEETGLALGTLTDWRLTNRYEIWPQWRARYAPEVTHNTEHVFGFLQQRNRHLLELGATFFQYSDRTFECRPNFRAHHIQEKVLRNS